jgi:hypothetical protein
MNPNENTCVACGKPIPEGRQVCLECEDPFPFCTLSGCESASHDCWETCPYSVHNQKKEKNDELSNS